MYAASEGDFCFFWKLDDPWSIVIPEQNITEDRSLTMGKVSSGGHNKGIGIELAQNQRADIPVSCP